MNQFFNVNIQEENDLQKTIKLIFKNYYLFIIGVVLTMSIAFVINKYKLPIYRVTSSIRIKENQQEQKLGDYINSSLFGTKQNLQDELLILQSSPVIVQTVKNLDLSVNYFRKNGIKYLDSYKNVPFKVMYMHNHVQPVGALFEIKFEQGNTVHILAHSKKASFYNYEKDETFGEKTEWDFEYKGKVGQLIENPELSFIIAIDSTLQNLLNTERTFYFSFSTLSQIAGEIGGGLSLGLVRKEANVIELGLNTHSLTKGVDILNSLMDVYSKQNLDRKNHLASITINYIDKQIGEISDSLSRTEKKLQSFRSTNQLLNITEQSTGISLQYRELGNQKAEVLTKMKYYQYVSDYLAKNEDISNLMVPASLGIQDPLLNNLMGELMTSQAQKSNLIESGQDKNPAVKKLSIKIDNLKKTLAENNSVVLKTTQISLDEINKRISRIEAEISRMPDTERQLTGIERKFRLNDAIYNYLMEKRAEANITKASNLPDSEIIEPAGGSSIPISPNKRVNYLIALVLGIGLPYGFILLRSVLNNKVESQEQIERITDAPVLGKILHNSKRTKNVVFEFPNSNIAESYRALRTNLEYYVRGGHKKVILVTSSIEGEGKSFNALNIAMSYAQLDRRTILIDFDLRKQSSYFNDKGENLVGMSSYLINKANLDDVIIHSPHARLDYITSGPIPPNPMELIGLEKTEKLITHLKDVYDCIIIDTPPLAQVSDAYLLMEQADVKVIVTRYNYSLKRVFTFIMKDLFLKNIGNICIVLNDNRTYRDQYGYGYGYNKKG